LPSVEAVVVIAAVIVVVMMKIAEQERARGVSHHVPHETDKTNPKGPP
jgi:hypothetical protein